MNQKTRVFLLGGGFGGMYAALHLDRIFAQDPDVEITLINRENYFLFTPMLHEVAASDLDVTHIVNPIRQMLRRNRLIGLLEEADAEAGIYDEAATMLTVPDWPGVWALGDCALVPDRTRTDGVPCPPTAQYALRQGAVVAHNIAASIRGGRRKAFVFGRLGQMAALGRRTGVANVLGVHFSGFLAWRLWRTVYLSKLPRFEKKLRVALDWTLDLIFSKDLVQFATPEPRPTAAPTRVIPEGGP
jgi:NADH dehydrogenase FAD-containing subunit